MILKLNVTLHYRLSAPMDLLLQIEAADLTDQRVRSAEIWTSDVAHFSRVTSTGSNPVASVLINTRKVFVTNGYSDKRAN